MKEIQLTQGKVALVDDEDYERLKDYSWCLSSEGYAYGSINKKREYMHRIIMNAPKGIDVDHINRIRTDNRKENLRLCSRSENRMNSTKRDILATSKYKGVYLNKKTLRWCALIKINKKGIHIGTFDDEIEAAKAYNDAVDKYHGEYGVKNNLAKIRNGDTTA